MINILIINGSHRPNGSTKILIDKFTFYFKHLNYCIKEFDLANYPIDFFSYDNKYSKDDYFEMIKDEMLKSDLIIFASPIYWYSMSAKMKTFIDRFNSLFLSNEFDKLKNKKILLLFTYGSDSYDECFIRPFELLSNYFKADFLGFYGVRSRFLKELYINKEIDSLKSFSTKILNELNHISKK